MKTLPEIETHIRGRLYKTGTWIPLFGGFSADPTGVIARYVLVGKQCTLYVSMPNNGTSNATSFTMTAPFTSASAAGVAWLGPILVVDNGSTQSTWGMAIIAESSTTINLYKSPAFAAWTASGGKRAWFTLIYEVA